MAQLLIEGVVDEVLAYLKANMATKVAALNTEYDDDIVLAAPVTDTADKNRRGYLDYDVDFRSVGQWPFVVVLGERTDIDGWHGDPNGFTDASHSLTVWVWDRDPDPSNLRRRMYRWGRAIWELVVDAHAVSDIVGEPGVGARPVLDFSPVITGTESAFVAASVLQFPVQRQEDR